MPKFMPRLNLKSNIIPLSLIVVFVITQLSFLLLRPQTTFAYPGNIGTCNNPQDCQALFRQRGEEWTQAVYGTDDMNLQSYVNEVFYNLIFTIVSLFGNTSQIPPDPNILIQKFNDILQITGNTTGLNNVPSWMASLPTSGIDIMYTHPPASGISYVKNIAQDFSLIKPAYAQTGFGFNQLGAFRDLWGISRNFAYAIFVIAFVVFGFMIMFRVKLNPQTVVTLQSILPRAIFILILVTFSYAIVGFAIDIMYAVSYVMIALVAPHTIGAPALGAIASIIGNVLNIFGGTFNNDPNVGAIQAAQSGFNNIFIVAAIIPMVLVGLMILVIAVLIPSIIGFIIAIPFSITTGGGSLGLATLGSALLAAFVLIALIIVFIIFTVRVFITLIKAYLAIVIALVTGPVQLVFGVLPGSKAIGTWLRTIFANLAVFPTIYLMFLLIEAIARSAGGGNAWIPPLLLPNPYSGSGSVSGVFGLPIEIVVLSFLILGIFFLIPKAADIVKGFMEGKAVNYGAALSQPFGDVMSVYRKFQSSQKEREDDLIRQAQIKNLQESSGLAREQFMAGGARREIERVRQRSAEASTPDVRDSESSRQPGSR